MEYKKLQKVEMSSTPEPNNPEPINLDDGDNPIDDTGGSGNGTGNGDDPK
jgi:hypothetical protein